MLEKTKALHEAFINPKTDVPCPKCCGYFTRIGCVSGKRLYGIISTRQEVWRLKCECCGWSQLVYLDEIAADNIRIKAMRKALDEATKHNLGPYLTEKELRERE